MSNIILKYTNNNNLSIIVIIVVLIVKLLDGNQYNNITTTDTPFGAQNDTKLWQTVHKSLDISKLYLFSTDKWPFLAPVGPSGRFLCVCPSIAGTGIGGGQDVRPVT